MTIYRQLDVPTVINAAGPVTRYGGSCLSRAVLAAMEEATGSYVRLDQLQLAVGKRLAQLAGTQAGYVTSGAAAGLTLGAAAIMAGMDVDRMDRLPETTDIPNEFILQQSHCGDYDHAIRAAGAKLVTIDCPEKASRDAIGRSLDSARTARTCGAVYVFRTADRGVPLAPWVAACHGRGLPVLVDASVRLPPAENLRRIPASGADLVVFVRACGAMERPVLFEEGPLDKGYLVIHPMCLSEGDVAVLVATVRQVLLRPQPSDPQENPDDRSA